ncbi:restriction endonuclease [Streptomyces sp. WAC01280]|uniref:restriction endonuclease n=1 Tax=Streptomyces sp. WAC01280 TaxID=2487424 RepID=UPI000F7A113F|nr:restriction endonuclease [Streptomyces sp. WAC01280]RSS57464.1 restriction endonuclease [Streptomyces sp. WAC01280]
MTYGSIVHDPTGSWDADLPLDREVNERLAATVLDWRRGDDSVPPPADIEQAALQLSGYAELQVRELRAALERLPRDLEQSTAEQLRTGITLAEAVRRLRAPAIRRGDPLNQAQSRARLVDALHSALDRTLAELPAPVPGP